MLDPVLVSMTLRDAERMAPDPNLAFHRPETRPAPPWDSLEEDMLRQARRSDIRGMHRVRMAVRENQLRSAIVTEADYVPAIESTGRGWVVESEGEIVAFAVGNVTDGNIWALFVDPGHERHGHGRRLLDTMVAWLWSRGLERLWLTTAPGTRAERLYAIAGWQRVGPTASGEIRFELLRPRTSSARDMGPSC